MKIDNKIPDSVQYAYILVMLAMTFPIIKYLSTSILTNAFCWIVSLLIIVNYSRKYFSHNIFVFLLIYIVVVALNFLSGDSYYYTPFMVLNEFFIFFISTSMAYYYINNALKSKFIFLFFLFGIFLIESTIVTIYATSKYPGLLRLLSNENTIKNNISLFGPFFRIGLSDYSIPHALPIIVPGLVFALRKSHKVYKLFYLSVLVAACLLANSSASVTALLMTILALLLSLSISASNLKQTKIRIVIIAFLFVPILTSQSVQLFVLDSIGQMIPDNYHLQRKVEDLSMSIVTNNAEGSVAAREERYSTTIDAISDNFLWGTNNPIGGHSTIPDRLATLGLIGFIPYVLFLCYSIKFALKFIKGPNLYYYYIGVLVALLLLMSKSMSNWPVWFSLFFLLPCMLLFCNKKNELLS